MTSLHAETRGTLWFPPLGPLSLWQDALNAFMLRNGQKLGATMKGGGHMRF